MRLRPYAPADWPALCDVHDPARREELRLCGLEPAFVPLETAAGPEGLFDGTVIVAEIAGAVCGFVAFDGEEVGWLYVARSHRRRGIGRALLRHAICALPGVALTTHVLQGNTPAQRLYASEGFRVVRRIDGRLVGNEAFAASGWLMERAGSADGVR